MTFLENKTLNCSFLTGLDLHTFAAQNCTCAKKVLRMQAFVVLSKENEINIAYWLVAIRNAYFA